MLLDVGCCRFGCFFLIFVQGTDLHYIDTGNPLTLKKKHILATPFGIAAGTFLDRKLICISVVDAYVDFFMIHCTIDLCFFVS